MHTVGYEEWQRARAWVGVDLRVGVGGIDVVVAATRGVIVGKWARCWLIFTTNSVNCGTYSHEDYNDNRNDNEHLSSG